MYLNGSRIADILVTIITIATQILIARLFFLEWKKQLPAFAAWALGGVLYVLWAAFLFASAVTRVRQSGVDDARDSADRHALAQVTAAGNVWGMTAVASFCIYLLYRYLVSRYLVSKRAPLHSPQRRALIHAAGVVAV